VRIEKDIERWSGRPDNAEMLAECTTERAAYEAIADAVRTQ
jgi:hypothetical protein